MTMGGIVKPDPEKLEKILLGRRISQFLLHHADTDDQRIAVENVARALAQDVCLQVREALAFELRVCPSLPHDLAVRIASDVQSVSSPFLASTGAFSDDEMAALIPLLAEHAHITLARRSDLGAHSAVTLITLASETTVTYLIRNHKVELPDAAFGAAIDRFGTVRALMDALCNRIDLPMGLIERLTRLVSDHCRDMLVARYDMDDTLAERLARNSYYEVLWGQIRYASPHQVHAFVIDLKKRGQLTEDQAAVMAEKGCLAFLESMVALEAGLTLAAVREIFYTGDLRAFVRVMQQASFSQPVARKCRRSVEAHRALLGAAAFK